MSYDLSDNGLAIVQRRYLRKDETGKPMETVEGMFYRVARHVASAHLEIGGPAHETLTKAYVEVMTTLKFLPNTPTFTGAGTPLGQLAACFVLPIDDDIGKDSKAGIFETLSKAARIQQAGGGIGFSFSRLRPRGDRVQKSAGIASGPVSFLRVYGAALGSIQHASGWSFVSDQGSCDMDVSYDVGDTCFGVQPVDFDIATGPVQFMKVYDTAFESIAQGGTRRGASMGVLRVDHPDIFEFIGCKGTGESILTGFNISVGITDKFMEMVKSDGMINLVNPRTGQPWVAPGGYCEMMRANDIMDEIVTYAHRNGEPGVLFLDELNRTNPLSHLYKIETTNPCVTKDTLIDTVKGYVPVSDLIGKPFQSARDGCACERGFFYTGMRPVLHIVTDCGFSIKCTYNHRLFCRHGWVCAEDLNIGDEIYTVSTNENDNDGLWLDSISSISEAGKMEVYDCQMISDNHSYISNGFISHNCGEQALGPYENCCLGSINLAKHIIWSEGERFATLDFESMIQTIRLAVRFLDDVITANTYVQSLFSPYIHYSPKVPSIPELREAAWKGRRIGLGYMGLADVLMACGARYGGKDGIEMTEHITAFMQYHAMLASIALAEERGPFPAIEGSMYDPNNIKWIAPDYHGPGICWANVIQGIKTYGIRNAAVTTIAPTGTIATVAGVEGYGLEPAFALSYSRKVTTSDGTPLRLNYASKLFARALAFDNIPQDHPSVQKVLETGSCQGIEGIPQWIQEVFVTSGDISAMDHIRMQATVQKFLSNSVSKTINFPRNTTKDQIREAYIKAWELKCRGLTVYVTGSREKIVLATGSK